MNQKLLQLIIQLRDEASAGLSSLSSTLGSVGGVLSGALTAALVGAGVAMAGLGVSSVKIAGDFQQGMSVLQAASGATDSQMQALSARAMALGNDITLPAASASDAATAMQELAKAGLTVDDTMAAAQGTLQLAAAAETDAATAASVVAGALNAFGMEGSKATQIADQLAAGANASAASMTDLSQGFQQAGFAFASTGQKSDDLVSALAMLTNVGLTGSDAGTALKNAMMQLMAPTDAAAKTMAQYGINVRDAQGNMLPFRDIIGALQTGLGGLSPAARDAALKTILMGDGMKAMIPLLDAGVAGFDAMKLKVNEAGAAQAMAAAQTSGFNGALGGIKNGIETLQLAIGSALLPTLTQFINEGISPAIGAITAFVQALIASGDPVGFLVAAISSALPGFASFIGFVQANLVPILAGLGAMILAVVVPAFWAWAASAAATALAMAPILLPILAIGAAVALLVAAWQNNWFGIQQVVAQAWAAMQPAFDQLVAWLSTNLPIAVAALAALWSGTLWPALQLVGSFIIGTVVPALAQIATWLMTNIPAAVAAGVGAFLLIASTVQTAFAAVSAAVSAGVGVVTTIMQAGWNTVVFVTSAAWNGISGVVGAAIGAVSAVVGPHVQEVVAGMQAAWATLQSVTSTAWAAIQMAVAAPVQAIQGVIGAAVALVQSVWNTGMQAAQTQTATAWAAVQTIITGAMLAVRVAISAGIAVVQTIMATAWSVVVAAAQNDFGRIPAIIAAGWERIKAIMAAGVSVIKGVAGTMAGAAAEVGRSIVSGIISGAGSMASALASKLRAMASGALSAAKAALGIHSPSTVFAEGVGMPIVDGIVMGLQQAAPKATGAMLDLAGKLVDLVSKGVDAFGKLRDLGAISFGAVASFVQTLQDTMTLFGEMTLKWDRAMMSAAGQFTGKSASVVEFMAKGIDFLLKLQTYQGVPQAVIHAFAENLSLAISELIRISTWQMRLALGAAVEFSNGAGKAIGILSSGVDGLNKLRTLADPIPGSFQKFATQVVVLVTRISEVAGWIGADAVASAGRFAEGAGKVLGILVSGVDGFVKLGTLADPIPGMFQKFALQVFALVLRMAEVASWMTVDAAAKAAAFADGAGKVVAIIGAGVDGFVKLQTFAGVAAAPIELFVQAVGGIVATIGRLTAFIAADAVTAASTFAEGAGKVVGIIGTGVDGFVKLVTFKGVPEAALALFAETLRLTMIQFGIIAVGWTTEAIAAASGFAEGAGKVVGIIGSGVDGFTKLAAFAGVPGPALALFTAAVLALIATVAQLANVISADALAAALRLSAAVDQVIGVVKSALDAFSSLGTASTNLSSFAATFVAAVQKLVADFQSAVVPPAQDIGTNIAIGIANGIGAGIPAIQNAVNAAVNAALRAAYAALGIASPSRVFDELVGQQAGAGLAQGLDTSIPMVSASAGALADAAVTPAVAAVGSRGAAAAASPAAAGGGGGGGSVVLEKGAITIVQQPGESVDALLAKLMPMIERKLTLKVR